MGERRLLGSLAREPLYNTRAVANATGVPVDTLRAWERRYDVPQPFRTASNQRLYSDLDIGIVNWLRDRTDEGMTISQAIQRLKLERPDLGVAPQPAPPPSVVSATAIERVQQRILDAALAFDRNAVEHALDEALARLSIEAFCTQLVESIIEELDDEWGSDALHLATRLFLNRALDDRLSALVRISTTRAGHRRCLLVLREGQDVAGRVIELLLVRSGWVVTVVSADLPADAIVAAVGVVRPELICLHATERTSLNLALAYAQILRSHADSSQRVVLCTGSMDEPVRSLPDVEVVTGSPSEMVERI